MTNLTDCARVYLYWLRAFRYQPVFYFRRCKIRRFLIQINQATEGGNLKWLSVD